MFFRSFQKSIDPKQAKLAWVYTLFLGLIIYGYLFVFNNINQNRFPYFKFRENQVLLVEREVGGTKDTVSWLCKRVKLWRYHGINLALYQEKNDSMIVEFSKDRDFVMAIYNQIPYFTPFDSSKQRYGVSILPSYFKKRGRWIDENLGLTHRVIADSTELFFNNQKIFATLIESRLTIEIIELIREKLKAKPAQLNKFNLTCNQSWLNWYSQDLGWLKTIYPDGSVDKVIQIEEIYWFERIPRFFNWGIR